MRRTTLIWFLAGAAVAIAISVAIAAGGGDSGSGATFERGGGAERDGDGERGERTGEREQRRGQREAGRRERAAPIELVGGEPVAGVRRLAFERGERVRLRISSDESATVRVEGLGAGTTIAAGETARLELRAERAGVFALVVEGSGATVAELVIEPRAPTPDRAAPEAPGPDEQGR